MLRECTHFPECVLCLDMTTEKLSSIHLLAKPEKLQNGSRKTL